VTQDFDVAMMTTDDQNEHPDDIDGCDQAADELANTAIDPEVVTAADRVARQYRDALQKLAGL
jgi:hypothetical protein